MKQNNYFLKLLNSKVSFFSFVISSILFSILILIIIFLSDIRLLELRINLEKKKYDSTKTKSILLVEKYKILRNSSFYTDPNEVKLAFLGLEQLQTEKKDTLRDEFDLLYDLTLKIVNFTHFIFGLEAIQLLTQNTEYRLFDLAYFYEYQRNFKLATETYNFILNEYNLDNEKKASIYLHLGYCYALNGSKKEAVKLLKQISEIKHGNQDLTVSAILLTEMIQKSLTQIKRVDSMSISLNKGIQYFHLTEYKKAIETLNKLEKSNVASQLLFYYRGRAYEETGNIEKAVKDYTIVKKENPTSVFADQVNKRLYISDSLYKNKCRNCNVVVKQATEDLKKSVSSKEFVDQVEVVRKATNVNNIVVVQEKKDTLHKKILTNLVTHIKEKKEKKEKKKRKEQEEKKERAEEKEKNLNKEDSSEVSNEDSSEASDEDSSEISNEDSSEVSEISIEDSNEELDSILDGLNDELEIIEIQNKEASKKPAPKERKKKKDEEDAIAQKIAQDKEKQEALDQKIAQDKEKQEALNQKIAQQEQAKKDALNRKITKAEAKKEALARKIAKREQAQKDALNRKITKAEAKKEARAQKIAKQKQAKKDAIAQKKLQAKLALEKKIENMNPQKMNRIVLSNNSIIQGIIEKISSKDIKILTKKGYQTILKKDIFFCNDANGAPCSL